MFELCSKRLRIIPLELRQFKLLLDDIEKLEEELGLTCSGEVWEDCVKEAMNGLYQDALKNHDNYVWYTNWQIILRQENVAVGSACFKKCPDENGEVEIGYGIHEKFKNKGYMTEALKTICNWALVQPGVSYVTAGTEKTNISSHKVLEKAGMKVYKDAENDLWWRLSTRQGDI